MAANSRRISIRIWRLQPRRQTIAHYGRNKKLRISGGAMAQAQHVPKAGTGRLQKTEGFP
eukprot:CAMPEP_0198501136 /NCGR_PEP_ID=MMETSP1462-20131121/8540_1 /TAXON_ID=1333877 /ORGANISM="Brandtodinium nutriculum, Strain RCC3387" /LENGTH=59 /DNA_ID=CAMNT_0044230165 /DNA_START=11 /DNA_END=186 /DNA_ORIENTATION=-